MPRRPRLAVPEIPWHIIQRGNNRSPCFYNDQDRRLYLATLEKQARNTGCQIHAYVLMTNHVHLLLTPEHAESASLMMKHLGQRYVQYINRTYGRSGTLWEGRFRSCLVQNEHYLLSCYRYIELNPVRANLVKHPGSYLWSSYLANAGIRVDPLVKPHELYLGLGRTKAERVRAYLTLFEHELDVDLISAIRDASNGNFALGGLGFAGVVERILQRRASRRQPGRPRKKK